MRPAIQADGLLLGSKACCNCKAEETITAEFIFVVEFESREHAIINVAIQQAGIRIVAWILQAT